MEHLYQHIVKVSCDAEQGSGILFYPKEGPHIIILSSKHVLDKADIDNYRIENISTEDGGFISINMNKSVGDIIIFDDESDLGAIVLLKSRINKNISINFLEALDRKFDFQNCVSLGYPEKNQNDIKSIMSAYRAQLESNSFIFESVLSDENLEELSSSSYDNLVGMSGGGLFYHNNSEYYLSGINFEFKNGYKTFHTVSISRVNEFLEKNKLSKIPLTYGTAIGINSNWINTKHRQALKELGERYTSEIESLDVPQMMYFKYLELGESFRDDIRDHFHQIILTLKNSSRRLNKKLTIEFYEETSAFTDILVDKFKEINWTVGGFENSNLTISELLLYKESVKKTIEKLQKEKFKILKIRTENGKTENDNPLYNEINDVLEIENKLEQFEKYINGDKIKIGQTGLLVITGDAGNGKSHLLGDITTLRIKKGLPSILVLGEKLLGNNDPREQILSSLGLQGYSWRELLSNLNEIGKFFGERFLVAIDALNEGKGRVIWSVHLPGFIEEFKKYPYLGLVVSIRSTYLKVILPENRFSNDEVIRIEHRGFQGMGLKALSHFCKCFKLNQPAIPLLSPEFTNPQFLLLTCKALRVLDRSDFPKGIQGITKMYKEYSLAISQKLKYEKNYEIPDSIDIVEDFILFLQNRIPNTKKVSDVYNSFKKYAYKDICPNLISDLIRENVLSEENTYISPKDKDVPVLKFTYEKFANHIEIKNILNKCNSDSINGEFREGGYFHNLCKQKYHLDEALLEALTIQLPEIFNLEIFELFTKEWLHQFKQADYKFDQIKKVWLNGLLWRLGGDINIEKCKEFINSNILPDENFSNSLKDILINLAIVKDHPFNALQLHNWLMKIPMVDRDIVWTKEIYHQFNEYLEEDEENSFAISRMIDWVLEMDEHSNMNDETRFLYCLTLGWFLGSNFQPLRDAATIGLVKLLEDHLDIMIELLSKFENVNDEYILERLLAVAYGVILRSENHYKISDLGTYIYQTYFDKRSLPVHIMIRDYARCIVEYEAYNNPNHIFDLNKVRPPYGAEMIQNLPSEKKCKELQLQFKKEFSFFDKCCYLGNHFIFDNYFGIDSNKLDIKSSIEKFYKVPKVNKSNNQKIRLTNRYKYMLDYKKYLPWIVNQIFEKGYDNTEHGHFDGTFVEGHYSSRLQHQKYGGHLESFGEKYGNIASDELLARIADNYDLIKDWGEYNIIPYNYAREIVKWSDIDPGNTKTYNKLKVDKSNKDNLYTNWNASDWLSIDDWPTIENLILHKDENDNEFINLLCERRFDEPIYIGEEKYRIDKKQLNLFGHSFIINTSDLSEILNDLKNRKNNHQLSGMFTSHNIFEREFYWSVIYNLGKSENGNNPDFNYFGNGWYMHIPIEVYQSEREFQRQTSKFKVSKLLFEGLGLRYSKKNDDLINSNDQKVVLSVDEPYENVFINKKILIEFLKENEYTILYAISGEKMDVRYNSESVLGAVYRQYYIGTHYFNENGEIVKDYKISETDPKD